MIICVQASKNILLNFKAYDNDAKMFGGLIDDELHKQFGKAL